MSNAHNTTSEQTDEQRIFHDIRGRQGAVECGLGGHRTYIHYGTRCTVRVRVFFLAEAAVGV